jgi:hypothetical protein
MRMFAQQGMILLCEFRWGHISNSSALNTTKLISLGLKFELKSYMIQ